MELNLEDYQKIQPTTVAHGLRWYLPNTHIAWRVDSLETKEPDTMAWIRSMKPNEVFYDVGANIGQYTMIAAIQGLQVFAFEPESQNYAVLTKNLAINMPQMHRAIAFPFCISDEQKIDTLRISNMMAGGSCHSFASDLNYKRQEKQWAYRQGTVGFTLDSLVFECGLPQPTHIKVDVDGFEDKVVRGAFRVLPHVQSILLELDKENADHNSIRDILLDIGFNIDEAQVEAARRPEGNAFAGIGNVIFKRANSAEGMEQESAADERSGGVQAHVGEVAHPGHAEG